MNRDEIFELWSFHMILRKGLGSDASSICYNAIHAMGQGYIDTFCERVENGEGDFAHRCKEAVPLGDAACNLLRIGFRLLEDEEWTFLEEYSFVAENDEDRVT